MTSSRRNNSTAQSCPTTCQVTLRSSSSLCPIAVQMTRAPVHACCSNHPYCTPNARQRQTDLHQRAGLTWPPSLSVAHGWSCCSSPSAGGHPSRFRCCTARRCQQFIEKRGDQVAPLSASIRRMPGSLSWGGPHLPPMMSDMTAFWAWRRFSASSKAALSQPSPVSLSITSSVTSKPRSHGRQCI